MRDCIHAYLLHACVHTNMCFMYLHGGVYAAQNAIYYTVWQATSAIVVDVPAYWALPAWIAKVRRTIQHTQC